MSEFESDFMHVLCDSHRATAERILRRIRDSESTATETIIREEIRGLLHGTMVVLDNGSSLADHTTIKIFDEIGDQFSPRLHERIGEFYDHPAEQNGGGQPATRSEPK